jgi:hypothetical protein
MYGIDLETQDKNWNGEGWPSVGQMVLHDNEGKVKVLAVKGNDVCCMFNEIYGLFLSHINQFKPIPNAAETAKKKAIDEMFKLTKDCAFASDARLILYNAGYTKSKVKPLTQDDLQAWFTEVRKETLLEYLIKNNYCIGNAD